LDNKYSWETLEISYDGETIFLSEKNMIYAYKIKDKKLKLLHSLNINFSINDLFISIDSSSLIINCRDLFNYKSVILNYNLKDDWITEMYESENYVKVGGFLSDSQTLLLYDKEFFTFDLETKKLIPFKVKLKLNGLIIKDLLPYSEDEIIIVSFEKRENGEPSSFSNIYKVSSESFTKYTQSQSLKDKLELLLYR
jgi:hypothetical protein